MDEKPPDHTIYKNFHPPASIFQPINRIPNSKLTPNKYFYAK